MKYNQRLFCALAALLFPLLMTAQAPRFLRGTVVAEADNLPLAAATVIERSTGNLTFTDENGWFEIKLEGENPRIEVEFQGLQKLEMAVGSLQNMTIQLALAPVTKKRRDRKKYAFSY